MPTYSITGPDGKTYEIDGPAGASREDVIRAIHARMAEAPKKSRDRSWAEVGTDIGASLVSGVGSVLSLPGQVYGITTGDFDNAALNGGKAIQEYGESLKSEGLKVRQALASDKISEADKQGIVSGFATAVGQHLKDPALASTFLAEQLPQIALAWLTSGATGLVTKGASAAAQVAAKTAAMKGVGAIAQGADIGSDTYAEALKLAQAQGLPLDEAKQVATNKARMAAVEAAGISLAAQNLPGASALEKKLAGGKGAGRFKTGLGEIYGEAAEEGGGKFVSNVGLQGIDPNQSLTQGVGSSAGLGALGGFGMGAAFGKGEQEATPTPAQGGNIAQLRAAAEAEKAAKHAAKQAKLEAATVPEVDTEGMTYGELYKHKMRIQGLPASKDRDAALRGIQKQLDALAVKGTGSTPEEQAQNKREAEYVAGSAFAQNEPDMFGEFGRQLPTEEQPTEEAAPMPQPGQQELPFALENQGDLFEEDGIPEPTLRGATENKNLITPQVLKQYGIKPNRSAANRALYGFVGKDLSDPKVSQAFLSTLDNYLQTTTASGLRHESIEALKSGLSPKAQPVGQQQELDLNGSPQGILDFGMMPPTRPQQEAPQGRPASATTLTKETLDFLGVKEKAPLRKFIGKDLADPASRAEVLAAMESYTKSFPSKQRTAFANTLRDMGAEQGRLPLRRAPQPKKAPNEPVSIGQAEPTAATASMGVADNTTDNTPAERITGTDNVGVATAGADTGAPSGRIEAQPDALTPAVQEEPAAPTSVPEEMMPATEAEEPSPGVTRHKASKKDKYQTEIEPVTGVQAIDELLAQSDTARSKHREKVSSATGATKDILQKHIPREIAGVVNKLNDLRKDHPEAVERALEEFSPKELAYARQFKSIKASRSSGSAEAALIRKGIQGKSLQQAMDWAVHQQGPTAQGLIAHAIANRMLALEEAGYVFDISIVDPGTTKIPELGEEESSEVIAAFKHSQGVTLSNGGDNGKSNLVLLNGSTGLDFTTLIHEGSHAVTAAAIDAALDENATGELKALGKELKKFHEVVYKYFENRQRRLPVSSLHKIERDFMRGANSLADIHEMLAWAVTDSHMQEYLDSIPYKQGKSAWGHFVGIIRDYLGLPANADTALSQALRLFDKVTDVDTKKLADASVANASRHPLSRANKTTGRDVTPEVAKQIEDNLKGKTQVEAADWLAKNDPSPARRMIARFVRSRLQVMQDAGIKMDLRVLQVGEMAPSSVVNNIRKGASGQAIQGYGADVRNQIYLNGNTFSNSGMEWITPLHELIHSVAVAATEIGKRRVAVGSDLFAHTQSLISVANTIINTFNSNVENKPREQWHPIEEEYYKRTNNALLDEHEIVAWAFTDPGMQNYLESIPYQSGTLWTRFVEAIRSLLGMTPKADTALAEVLRVGEAIMNYDPKAVDAMGSAINSGIVSSHGQTKTGVVEKQIYPNISNNIASPAAEAYAGQVDIIGEREPQRTMIQNITEIMKGVNPLVRYVDKHRVLRRELGKLYGGIRDSAGHLNPMALVAQALDGNRVGESVLRMGRLAFTQDGIGTADELVVPANSTEFPDIAGQKVSTKSLLEYITAQAKAEGKTYDQIDKVLSTKEYAHREFELDKFNKQVAAHRASLKVQLRNRNLNKAQRKDLQKKLENLPAEKMLALTPAEIARGEALYQADDKAKIVTQMKNALRFAQLDTLVESGRLSEEQAQSFKDNQGYIPFDRLGNFKGPSITDATGVGRGVAAIATLKSIKGSDRQVASTTDSFVGFMMWSTKQALQNNAAHKAVEDMVLGNLAHFGAKPKEDSPGGTVTIYDKGEPKNYYLPDPNLLVAFLDQETGRRESGMWGTMIRAAQVLRVGITALPPFAVKQVSEDIFRAYAYAGVQNPAQLIPRILKNFPTILFNEARGVKSVAIKRLENMGIVGSYDLHSGDFVKNIMVEAGADKRTLRENIVHYGELWAKSSDVAVRQAIYEQTMKESKDEALAEHRARELINFSRRGYSSRLADLSKVVPFTNAYIQGTDKLWSAAIGHDNSTGLSTGAARKLFYTRMLQIATMSSIYALAMGGDDDYEQTEDYVKYNNFLLPGTKERGYAIGIPVPREIGIFAKAIPEAVFNYLKTEGTEDQKSGIEMLLALKNVGLDVFMFNGIPSLVKPFIENAANYSFFMGRDLESPSQENLLPHMRYGAGTSPTLVDLASAAHDAGVEVSPIKIENALRGLGGTTAGVMLAVLDSLVNPTRSDRPLQQQFVPQAIGASAFIKAGIGTQELSQLYALNKKTSQVKKTFDKLVQEDPEAASGMLEKDGEDLNIAMTLADMSKSYLDNIRQISKMRTMIEQSELSPAEKREEIDKIKMMEIEIARDVRPMIRLYRGIE